MSQRGLGERTADVETSAFSIEVKHRGKLPLWIHGAMDQAERNARDGKLPLLVLHECGRHHRNDLVVLRLGDFRDWFGDLEPRMG